MADNTVHEIEDLCVLVSLVLLLITSTDNKKLVLPYKNKNGHAQKCLWLIYSTSQTVTKPNISIQSKLKKELKQKH